MCVSFSTREMPGLCAEAVKPQLAQNKNFNNNGFHFILAVLLGLLYINTIVSVCYCIIVIVVVHWIL